MGKSLRSLKFECESRNCLSGDLGVVFISKWLHLHRRPRISNITIYLFFFVIKTIFYGINRPTIEISLVK